jgi:hypothetical protein
VVVGSLDRQSQVMRFKRTSLGVYERHGTRQRVLEFANVARAWGDARASSLAVPWSTREPFWPCSDTGTAVLFERVRKVRRWALSG